VLFPTEVRIRLKDKIAIVLGAGQSPGEGLGNGRATVLRFAQEGAKVLAVDNNLSSAEETVAMARQPGGECLPFEADVTNETASRGDGRGRTATLGTHRRTPLRREYRWRGRAA
jgi:NAD(P)-dependent dehydrogenase (short-subunit alcohol dehydrogenase family)